MGKVTERENRIGQEIWFMETQFNREILRYGWYCEAFKPIADEFKRIGMPALTKETIGKLLARNYGFFSEQFKELASKEQVTFVFQPVLKDAVNNGAAQLINFLYGFENSLRTVSENGDCPVVHGYPTITDEFRQEVRDRFVCKIKTEEESEFYDAYLQAEASIKLLLGKGAQWGVHFDTDRQDGIRFIDLPKFF